MNHKELLHKFYSSFSDGNAQGMIACYHEDIIFQDPAFGILKGDRAKSMWEMLLSKKNGKLSISYDILEVNKEYGKVKWTATYKYGPKKKNRY
ncbi:nuclear transport factor 2 family protein [Gillisia marina]|uniref:nuclear transport factor 2 family protein n=1 Tax=Gillisia marina TaxID=1167637 RepID=UPI001ED97D80|nr:nuclear transport factor 2 family protein [Gillisia marina]